jgi:hypothetical protein
MLYSGRNYMRDLHPRTSFPQPHVFKCTQSHEKPSQANPTNDPNADEQKHLLRERGMVEDSLNQMDNLIGSISATRQQFGDQTDRLRGFTGVMGKVNAMFPGMDNLIGKIGTRKRMESLVLMATVAVCITVIIFVKFIL